MLPTTSLRLAIVFTSTSPLSIAAGARPSASAILATKPPTNAMKGNNGAAMHSRFAGMETDLICNHNFV